MEFLRQRKQILNDYIKNHQQQQIIIAGFTLKKDSKCNICVYDTSIHKKLNEMLYSFVVKEDKS